MHQIPYLLLDIDGVLIPFPAEDQSTPTTHTRHQVQLTNYPDPIWVWLNPEHGPLITDAVNTGLVRPVWCTSWRIDAPRQIGPLLELPTFEHIELPRLPITTSHPDGYLWKRDHVERWLADAPAVWIDDDFTPARPPVGRLPHRPRSSDPACRARPTRGPAARAHPDCPELGRRPRQEQGSGLTNATTRQHRDTRRMEPPAPVEFAQAIRPRGCG